MRKLFTLFLAACLCFGLVACASEEENSISSIEAVEEKVENSDFEERVLVDNENLVFTIKDVSEDTLFGTWDLNVFIENKTDIPLSVSWDEVSVNGYMIDPFWGTEVGSMKKENTPICFYFETFEENGIEKVENVEFLLRVVNADTWETISEENFIVNFK